MRATHEQIARDTGAVRETVTRMLRHFADDGIVSLGRGTVTVTDAEKIAPSRRNVTLPQNAGVKSVKISTY